MQEENVVRPAVREVARSETAVPGPGKQNRREYQDGVEGVDIQRARPLVRFVPFGGCFPRIF